MLSTAAAKCRTIALCNYFIIFKFIALRRSIIYGNNLTTQQAKWNYYPPAWNSFRVLLSPINFFVICYFLLCKCTRDKKAIINSMCLLASLLKYKKVKRFSPSHFSYCDLLCYVQHWIQMNKFIQPFHVTLGSWLVLVPYRHSESFTVSDNKVLCCKPTVDKKFIYLCIKVSFWEILLQIKTNERKKYKC